MSWAVLDPRHRPVSEREAPPFEVRRESEALAVIEDGVATPEMVDRLFSLYLGTDRGPLARMDAAGLDVGLDIEEHYADERPRPA